MNKMAVLVLLLLVFALACSNKTTVLEVSPSTSGGAIDAAMRKARSGDTILLRAGIYTESVEVDKSITLAPFGDGPVWIDAGCSGENGVRVTASGVTIRGLGIKRSEGSAVQINKGASQVTLEELTIQDFNCRNQEGQHRAGIAVNFAGSGIRILNNIITYRVGLGGSPRGHGNGIWFLSDSDEPSGGDHRIVGNLIVGGFDGIGGEVEDDPRGTFDRNTVIERNVVTDCWDDGIQVEGGNKKVYVRDNRIQRCAVGIAFAPNLEGPLYIEGNTILDLRPGFYDAQIAFKVGDGDGGVAYLTDNTVLSEGDGILQTDPGLGRIVARRNTFQVSRWAVAVTDAFPPGTSFNENCYWSTDRAGRFIKWGEMSYSDLATFRTSTGQEGNGRQSSGC